MSFGDIGSTLNGLVNKTATPGSAPRPSPASNQTTNTNAQCKVVVYRWNNEYNGIQTMPLTDGANPPTNPTDADLAASNRLEISSQITSVSFSKNIGEPAGNFTISLTSSPQFGSNDWKDILKRGYWVVIYMSQKGDMLLANKVETPTVTGFETQYIRCIGFIERAGVKISTGEKGDIDMSFEISGRDFGVIYEETSAWHNMFKFEEIMLQGVRLLDLSVTSNVRIDEALRKIHDLLFFPLNVPGAKVNSDKSLLSIGLQWLLPKEMLLDIGFTQKDVSQGTYWGALAGKEIAPPPHSILKFSHTACGIALEQPADFLSGNAWDALKKISIPQLHELFCETDSKTGLPGLIFRPIPWGIDDSKYNPSLGDGKITLFKDLAQVSPVPQVDLFEVNLSEDDHSRYNHFLATVSTHLYNVEDNITPLQGSRFPLANKASIKRYGFRPMHVSVDTLIKNEQLANGEANNKIVIAFNEVMVDYWANAVFSETGTINKLGSPDVKVGYALEFGNDVPYLFDKRFYIESYTDNFTVGENGETSWVQDIALTRGFNKNDLQQKSISVSRTVAFGKSGEYTPGGANR